MRPVGSTFFAVTNIMRLRFNRAFAFRAEEATNQRKISEDWNFIFKGLNSFVDQSTHSDG